MVDKVNVEFEYKQNLEKSVIRYLAYVKHIEVRKAIDIYYNSKLSKQIEQGVYGIENMDFKYLVQDLAENEPELFI